MSVSIPAHATEFGRNLGSNRAPIVLSPEWSQSYGTGRAADGDRASGWRAVYCSRQGER